MSVNAILPILTFFLQLFDLHCYKIYTYKRGYGIYFNENLGIESFLEKDQQLSKLGVLQHHSFPAVFGYQSLYIYLP